MWEIRKYFELDEVYPSLWYTVKAVLRGKFITLNAYSLKKFWVSNWKFCVKNYIKENKLDKSKQYRDNKDKNGNQWN